MSQTKPGSLPLVEQIIVPVTFCLILLIGIAISQQNQTAAKKGSGIGLTPGTSEPRFNAISATSLFTHTTEPTKPQEITPSVIATLSQTPTSEATMVLSQKVNNIEITAHNIRRGDNMLKADICFPVLDSGDWMLNQIALRYDGKEIRDWGGSLIDPIIPIKNGQPGKRCDMVYFSVSDQEEISEFTISVESIYAPPREGGMCERINAVQQKLDSQESGIKLKCQEENGMARYQIVMKPKTLSLEEAQMIVMNAVNNKIQGPWDFIVRLK